MPDKEQLVLGRTEANGQSTSLTIWDVLGNEPLRHLTFDASSVGLISNISFLDVSLDSRFVVVGFQNSYDGNANYIVHDLHAPYHSDYRPQLISFDAKAECAAVLNREEMVTGTSRGELFVWNIRTAKSLRQLLPPAQTSPSTTLPNGGRGGLFVPATAHQREVKSLAVSQDRQYLASASADGLLRVWDIQNEALVTVLKGHTDEVNIMKYRKQSFYIYKNKYIIIIRHHQKCMASHK